MKSTNPNGLEPKSKEPLEKAGDSNGNRFDFRHGWFDMIRSDWEELTLPLRGKKKLRILEVGCFEGACTTFMLDNLMGHAESSLTVIDTFAGGMEHQDALAEDYGLDSLEARFRSNVSQCEHVSKLRIIKARSDEALMGLRKEGAQFDFIYIDASHVAIDVLQDAVLSWPMLSLHGTMVFDDFTWKGYNEDYYNPRIAIMSFLQCAAPTLQTRETESQMWVTKVPNHIPATKNPDPSLMYWDKGLRFTIDLK